MEGGFGSRRGKTRAAPSCPAGDFVAIDFETANAGADSACAVGLVKVSGGRIVDTAVHLIRPPTRQFQFTFIHGLAWRDVAECDDFGALWPTISGFLAGATFLAAHNAPFDRRVLNACCATYGLTAPTLPFHCTVRLARQTWSIRPTKLSDVCRALGIALDHHEALSDARACAAIVLAARTTSIAATRPEEPSAPPDAASIGLRPAGGMPA
ncbi:DNA polymerase-3 subunit epsilon [Roseiarcus fermentans]|uniref:DNA polymerase-3 subunit epsilon n=2 Tax=Roseiarcus fermentans TaxID=1473586 RepID=A0A366FC94_9HYPH|nr:DNA polymerase-3 subunit epsilon [Roseiarcus fermentans]